MLDNLVIVVGTMEKRLKSGRADALADFLRMFLLAVVQRGQDHKKYFYEIYISTGESIKHLYNNPTYSDDLGMKNIARASCCAKFSSLRQ